MTTQTCTLEDFANAFGVSADTIPIQCRTMIENANFDYTLLSDAERDEVILDVMKRIDEDTQIIGDVTRKAVWEKGWGENLSEYVESNFDESKLVPKFVRPNQLIRWQQNYIKPDNPHFELDFIKVMRIWLFSEFFSDVDNIYEFGCGTGFNLLAMAELFPDKTLVGSDFVNSSVKLVNKIAGQRNLNLTGQLFDMLTPDYDLRIAENSGVLTFGSLEQLASNYGQFLEYLFENKPKICVHIEPTVELYDSDNLIDYLAIRFFRKRGYTESFLPHLQKLHDNKRIELVKVKRMYCGSLLTEGYNVIAWKML